jgi:hypothetical protein
MIYNIDCERLFMDDCKYVSEIYRNERRQVEQW